jgi:hypothetical protein
LRNALRSVYPNEEWLPWIPDGGSPSWFESEFNCRIFMDWLAEQLCINYCEDWYSLDKITLNKWAGSQLSKKYQGSIIQATKKIYPNTNWLPWRFQDLPEDFWKNSENRMEYSEWIIHRMDIINEDDWLNIKPSDFLERDGSGFVEFHGGFSKTISHLSGMDWEPWIFEECSRKFWEDTKNRRRFFDWVGERLGIQSVDDWYQVGRSELIKWSQYLLECIYQVLDSVPSRENSWIFAGFDIGCTVQYLSPHKLDGLEVQSHSQWILGRSQEFERSDGLY